MIAGLRSGVAIALGFIVLAVVAANQATIAINLIPYYARMVNPYTFAGFFVTEKSLGFDNACSKTYAWNCVGAGAPAVGDVSTVTMQAIAATQIAWGLLVLVAFLVVVATAMPAVREWVIADSKRVWGLVVTPLALLMVAAAQMLLQGFGQLVTWAVYPRDTSTTKGKNGTVSCDTNEPIDGVSDGSGVLPDDMYPCHRSKALTVFPYDFVSTIWRLSVAPNNKFINNNDDAGTAPCNPNGSCTNYDNMWNVDVISNSVVGTICVVVIILMILQVQEHRPQLGDPAVLWFVQPLEKTFKQTKVVTAHDARGHEVPACYEDTDSPLGGTLCDDIGSGLVI